MCRLPIIALFLVCALSHAGNPPSTEEHRIDYLIASIASLRNVQFIRNGVAYDARAAADHLRLKRFRAGSRVVTAEDFIKLCAAGSSLSGTPYTIRFADGHVVTSEVYLRQRLAAFVP